MKQGDFTKLAKDYIHRTGYSPLVLRAILTYIGSEHQADFRIADVGAGTGKLTESLLDLGLQGFAVEPNDAMRAEGSRLCKDPSRIHWQKGSAEETGLETGSVNWLTMASSFHWPDQKKALTEFHRVLRPGGYFTCMWNPRNLSKSPLHLEIEAKIHEMVPGIDRVSSGSSKYTDGIEEVLVSNGKFKDVLFMETSYEVEMTKDRYIGAWRSVNDIQAQAGPERWEKIMQMIDEITPDPVYVPYKTRAWTAQRID